MAYTNNKQRHGSLEFKSKAAEEEQPDTIMASIAKLVLPGQQRRKSNEKERRSSELEKQWSDNQKLNLQMGSSCRHFG
eukprot:CAMPEP_0178926188 /NCGR_PEP_ID=MMETSP0786-20121207/18374_1 /TAXON_ID=186022 /ORGANISM="Thalassionema frauenfeldii, Strain CCMP 1798" /LENGTH=77 /DNA_ID=CAMNT_0020601243 /DNA_START=23 /DNA_END=256 /DNA_ORIENTATION=+